MNVSTATGIWNNRRRMRNERLDPRIRREKRNLVATVNATPAVLSAELRRFVLIRNEDISGTSGTGEVAEGTIFTSGKVALNWLREPFSIGIY